MTIQQLLRQVQACSRLELVKILDTAMHAYAYHLDDDERAMWERAQVQFVDEHGQHVHTIHLCNPHPGTSARMDVFESTLLALEEEHEDERANALSFDEGAEGENAARELGEI